MTTIYARAGERIYGTRIRHGQVSDYHHCTVRHDLYLGELPDFPACLGDWQQENPPLVKEAITTVVGTATTGEDGTVTGLTTNTAWVELSQHGNGAAPVFGVPGNPGGVNTSTISAATGIACIMICGFAGRTGRVRGGWID